MLKWSEEERRAKEILQLQNKNERYRVKKEAAPKKEKKRVYTQQLMYRDTFKQYTPKALRVMRG